jgi:hypothetical protein
MPQALGTGVTAAWLPLAARKGHSAGKNVLEDLEQIDKTPSK